MPERRTPRRALPPKFSLRCGGRSRDIPTSASHDERVTDEERGLLAAIVDAPDDDAPRLVYADWLQSRGDPRGELIQLQCQLAAAPDDDRRRAIRIRENKLLAAHAAEWRRPIESIVPENQLHLCKFEHVRGFVEDATITLRCLPHLEDLFEVAPLLRRLRIVPGQLGADGYTTKLEQPHLVPLESPMFARLHALELALPGAGNAVATTIAAASTLRNLRELRIGASAWGDSINFYRATWQELIFDDTGAATLAASPHLAALQRLDLEANRIGLAGLDALSKGPWRLRELVLTQNLLDRADARQRSNLEILAHAFATPAFADLEVLALASMGLEPPAVTALVGGPHLAKLRDLDLERCHLGAAGTAALCDALKLPELRRLRLERNSLGDAGAIAIAGCAALANLTSFEAGHNRIGQKGAIALATSPYLAKLERLTLNEPRWKPETAAILAASTTLANTRIYLGGRLVAKQAKLDAAAAKATADSARAAKKSRSKQAASADAAPAEKAAAPKKRAKPADTSKPAPKSKKAKPT
jgi:uncharacterized protein (TIGR02996 family)